MKLYGTYPSLRTRKIQVAAQYAGLDITLEEFWPTAAPEDVQKEYRKKNPNMKIPVLETPEGPLYESNAILRYIARSSKNQKLYGATKFEEALVDQYLDWCATLLETPYFTYLAPYFGRMTYNEELHVQSREKAFKAFKVVEDRLAAGHKYLVGNGVTLADIIVVSYAWTLFRHLADDSTRNHFPHLSKYVEEFAQQEQFKNVFGRFVHAKTPLPLYTKPLPEEETKKAEPKKAAEPKPKKEAAPAPKKTEKKKKDEDEDEDDAPKEKKEKNPLDSLPPSSFNLFDYKTLFVNHPNKHEAFEVFLQQFDPEGYSCWHMEYDKAEGEGRVVFLTSNLMNGFLQRLETFRKYAFGVVGVYGEEPDLQIKGAWVWRGTEIPFEIKDHPSGEWYKFRKLDVKNNETDRKIMEEYWCKMNEDEDIVEGLRARDVKYYK